MSAEPTDSDAAKPIEADSTEQNSEAVADNWMFARLQPAVFESLSKQQKQALHEAVIGSAMGPPVNIRLTVPFWSRRFYLTNL